jgi:ABC-2 type transport system ATP-binding protein
MRHNKYNVYNVITKDNKEITFKSNKVDSKKLAKLIEDEQILSIHSSEPTLETVFIELTGKELV